LHSITNIDRELVDASSCIPYYFTLFLRKSNFSSEIS
jgi:hypothetical protein